MPSTVLELQRQLQAAHDQGVREANDNLLPELMNAKKELHTAHTAAARSTGLVDELKELVSYGDFIVRKVGNGYVIRRIPGDMYHRLEGVPIETWVVEGNDIKGAADQLCAIQANDVLEKEREREKGPHAETATGIAMGMNAALTRGQAIAQALGSGVGSDRVSINTIPNLLSERLSSTKNKP